MGYIQDGPLGPFGPTEIAPRSSMGVRNAIKQAFLAVGGSGGSKWLDLSGSWLDFGWIHPGWSVGAMWTHQNWLQGPPGGSKMAQKWLFSHSRPLGERTIAVVETTNGWISMDIG